MVKPAEVTYGALGGIGFAVFAVAVVQIIRRERNDGARIRISGSPSGGGASAAAQKSETATKAQAPRVTSDPVTPKEKKAGSQESD